MSCKEQVSFMFCTLSERERARERERERVIEEEIEGESERERGSERVFQKKGASVCNIRAIILIVV
jgi:hypothetical protein